MFVDGRRTRVPVSAGVGAVGDTGPDKAGEFTEMVSWGRDECEWVGEGGGCSGRSGSTEAGWERERRRSERRVSICSGRE